MSSPRRLPLFEQFIGEQIYNLPTGSTCSPQTFAYDIVNLLAVHYHGRCFRFSKDVGNAYVRIAVTDEKTGEQFFIGVGADSEREESLGEIDFYADCNLSDVRFEELVQAIDMKLAGREWIPDALGLGLRPRSFS